MNNSNSDFGKMLRQRRIMMSLKLVDLAKRSGVSSSHLGRIEGGERFPSAHILRKLARPLDFEESELFTLAGYLPARSPGVAGESPVYIGGLDSYVGQVLAEESVEVQRAAIAILTILKTIARSETENKQVSS